MISKVRRDASAAETRCLDELAVIYADADRAFSGWSCPSSTECCRFGLTGREPYVTSIELLAIRRRVASLGGERALGRDAPSRGAADVAGGAKGSRAALPVLRPVALERRCPLLSQAGRCGVYGARPLGCRTFFCDRASPGERVRHKDVSALVRRVQDLAARHEPDGDRGRPLTRALPVERGPRR